MSFNIFSNSLDELEELAFNNPSSMASIIGLILPEKEIFKKILTDKIPGLSEEDIDLMAEAAFDDEDEDEDNEVDSEDEIEETKEEKKARKEREKEEKKAEKEQKKQQKESRRQEKTVTKEKEKEEREKKKQERKEKLKEEREKRKEELKEIYKEKWENFKKEIKELVNKIKTAIFQFFNRFLEVSKAFILSLINIVTSLPGAVVMVVAPPWNVPGAVTILLGVIISYLDLLSKIQSIVPFLQPLRLLPNVFTNDDLRTTGTTLNVLTRSLIQFYVPILGLRNIILKVIEFIKSLFSPSDRREKIFKQATKKLIKLGHIKSTRPRVVNIIDENDEEGAKLKIHPGLPGIPSGRRQPNLIERFDSDGSRFKIPSVDQNSDVPVRVYSWDSEDVEEILSLLEQFKITNTKKWGGESHVSDYRSDINKVLNQVDDLEKQLDESFLRGIGDIDTSEFDQFVYDITLPDGTIIPGVSEEGLEYYRKKFDLEIITN